MSQNGLDSQKGPCNTHGKDEQYFCEFLTDSIGVNGRPEAAPSFVAGPKPRRLKMCVGGGWAGLTTFHM